MLEGNQGFTDNISRLQEAVKKTNDLDEKEALYKEIDQENEAAQANAENYFKYSILPEAFAVVKETARRFVENIQQSKSQRALPTVSCHNPNRISN